MEAAVRWSPHSNGHTERFLLVDVVDHSLTLHQIRKRARKHVDFAPVARYARLPSFGAFDWSKTDESIVALGLVSGSACLVQLREQRSETIATFKLKQQRKCNSIALSAQNWLAVALDKTRSDNCLNIFDANGDPDNPIRRLCPAEVVSSVRFFPSQPLEVVVAAQRSLIRLYDLRDAYLSNNNNVQVSTRNVNNIAIDPLDENYFASAGSTDDPSVTVWDKRWISNAANSSGGAVFEFRPAVDNDSRTSIFSLRYSGQRRGRLAVYSSRGELKVIDMVEGKSSSFQGSEYPAVNPYGGAPWTLNQYVSQIRTAEEAEQEPQSVSVVRPKLIAFDWISDSSSVAEQSILALRSNRRVEAIRVPNAVPQISVTARSDISLAFDDNLQITETRARAEVPQPQAPYEQQRTAEDFGPLEYSGEEGHDAGEDKVICEPGSPQLASMLASSTVQRERCRQGYLWDCHKNMTIVAGNWQLERLWEIINRFREQAADGGMIGDSLDLSYVGVGNICSERVGNLARRTLSPSISKVEDAIFALNVSRDLPPFEGERTEFPEHRQLCLELCGWKFTTETLEIECQELVERGLYYQAIVQAVLHDYKHIALNLLRTLIRSKTIPNIGLGALLASDTINEEQREMCLWMTADTDNPALKALLTFLASDSWRDVMKTNYLHGDYRTALALKYLNDTELAGFMQSETARAVRNGDLEGILLTGLGEQAMDLLQAYVTKTNDLQSAVLATAFTNPIYVDDARWEMWKETYFEQMQSWRAFSERSKFVALHSQMAMAKDGRSMVEIPAAQVALHCNSCQRALAKHDGRSMVPPSQPPLSAHVKGTGAPAASAGIICPRCGRHMPRCGVCRHWLGTPDPRRKGGAKELQKLGDVMAKFVTFCVSCQHGFHADHARDWFEKHDVCPVPDCICLCFAS